ncbi:YcjF family protein [Litoreibacter janthinus]|uniref:Putative membrane protein n=1 Tax=Litoreibacter janthinus TaxID=670154 RepID=A0A1I6HW35_9RHOB|nr:TIGR01620 family protein [Litoreibacter janthinus]SFR58682.1 putative membrane protein [Litoreibacter janthinus]
MSKRPVLIELDEPAAITPATAPVIADEVPQGRAMQSVAALAARKPSRLAKFFWSALVALVSFVASVAAWDFVNGLIERSPILGAIAVGLTGLFVLALLLIAGKEWLAIGRLKKIDGLRKEAESALATGDLKASRAVSARLMTLYANRPELEAGRAAVRARDGDKFDADAVLGEAETQLLVPLDALARLEVEAAARQVATVTAIVPLALADLVAALTSNLRMIRRIAEIYGGRSGTLGSWRLTRAVLTHLVATGAVAVGDDLIGSIAGGGVLSKLSRRFGEGVINGALTARVGVAAMDVCRPLPYTTQAKPSVSGLVRRALTGLFPTG